MTTFENIRFDVFTHSCGKQTKSVDATQTTQTYNANEDTEPAHKIFRAGLKTTAKFRHKYI